MATNPNLAAQQTLQTAILNVNMLDTIPVHMDGPCLQASTPSVHYQVNFDTNFEDCNAFTTGHAKLMEEAKEHSELNKLLEKGHEFAITLYTWRSIAVSLPQPKSNDDPNRDALYHATYKILEPPIQKLREFMRFINGAISRFSSEVRRLSAKDRKTDFISEGYLLTLGKMLRMFCLLDRMKLMSSGIKNDLAYYRRAFSYLRKPGMEVPGLAEAEQESQELSMFVANQNNITRKLQESIHCIPHYEDLLCDIISTCANMYEQKRYVLPDEKHRLVVIIAYALMLLENTATLLGPGKDKKDIKEKDQVTLNKMTKKINVPKIDKIFKECKTINMYGDMFIDPFEYYVMKMPNYSEDSSKWVECNSGRISIQGALLEQMPRFREEYSSLMAELTVQSNMDAILNAPDSYSVWEHKLLADTALRGLQRLSGWTSSVLEMFTWKLANPTNSHLNPECPKDAGPYQKVTQFNYTSQEKFALIEMVSMIKSAQALMLRMDSRFSEAIRRTVYLQLQHFVQHTLQKPLQKAAKSNKREIMVRLIDAVRVTCIDPIADSLENSFRDMSMERGKGSGSLSGTLSKKSGTKVAAQTAAEEAANALSSKMELRRNVGPSTTQLYSVRTMLESMLDKSGGRHTLRNYLDAQTLAAVDDFYKRTFYWPYLLNYTATLRECGDLSQLWYREFFINMSKDDIQFPIEMSIPWILVSHILDTEDSAHMEYLLYPLDLYNDAAHCALYRFKKRHLYDEIEAETNLVFEQLIYKLSGLVFQHFKARAASLLLDKRFRAECSKLSATLNHMPTYPKSNRYVSLLQQRNVEVLGRSVNLNRLVAVKMNDMLLKSLRLAIDKFRSDSLTTVVELEATLECNRLCHRIMSEHMDLDEFDDLLAESNQQVTSPIGFITEHIFWEVNYELMPHYCYNGTTNRFVRTVFSLSEKPDRTAPSNEAELNFVWGTRNLSHSYQAIFKLYSGFIGAPHFAAMARLLGYEGIFLLIREFVKIIKNQVATSILGVVRQLAPRMPNCTNAADDYVLNIRHIGTNSARVFNEYLDALKNVIAEPKLKTSICHAFSEFGNLLLFCMLLEQSLGTEESIALKHKHPFLSVPEPYPAAVIVEKNKGQWTGKPGQLVGKEAHLALMQKYIGLKVPEVMKLNGNEREIELTERYSACLTEERLCVGLVLFPKILAEAEAALTDHEWYGLVPVADGNPNGAPNFDKSQPEFHRIWSAIQFTTCCTDLNERNQMTVEELFGEGLQWGGLALMVLLKQIRRFEAMDIGYHLIRILRLETASGVALAPGNEALTANVKRAVDRLKRFQTLNHQVLSILCKHMKYADDSVLQDEEIHHILPPVFQG